VKGAGRARRVLLIAYHFPPLGGIASLRLLRFARLLPEHGWDTYVLTAARGDFVRDPSLDFPAERTRRAFNFEISRTARGALGLAPGAAEALPARSPLVGLRDLARRWLYRPDAQIGWYPFALAAARRLLLERRVDALLSTAYPMTAHLVARRLQRETRLPWVADFRDLWSDWSTETGLRLRLDQQLERDVLARATAVTTVSPTYVDVLRARGARRVELLTNAFDEELFDQPAPEPEPATFAYLGTYYPGYQGHLETALRALGRLRADGRVPGLRLRFIGAAPRALEPLLDELGLRDRTEATGFLAHHEAARELRRAGVTFFAGPEADQPPALRGNLAGKVFEYLAAGRPIVLVGHPDSDVARLLRPFARARVVPVGDVDAAAGAFAALEASSSALERGAPAPRAPGASAAPEVNSSAALERGAPAPQPPGPDALGWRGRGERSMLQPFASRTLAHRLADLLDSLC
jgi:glycosyltransferase involved in cell wall biosynthesis